MGMLMVDGIDNTASSGDWQTGDVLTIYGHVLK